jgi:hypothetical protein
MVNGGIAKLHIANRFKIFFNIYNRYASIELPFILDILNIVEYEEINAIRL